VALAQAGDWPAQIASGITRMPAVFDYGWTRPLASDDARLAPIGGRLWVAFADGRLFELRRGASGLEDQPSAVLQPGGYRPAYGSDPVYVTDSGEVGRWAPEGGWRPAWQAGPPGSSIDAFGLQDARILLSSSQWPDATRLLDERAGAVVWSLPIVSTRMLALSGVALGWQAGHMHAIDLADGRVLWRREGVLGAVALSEASAWLADEEGALVEVAIATGATNGRADMPLAASSRAVAPDGRLYSVGRPLEVRVFDLVDGTRPVCNRLYEEIMLRGAPRVVALAPDGCLIVATADTLLELHPEHDDVVRERWRTDQLIVETAAQDGQLAMITVDDRGGRFLTHWVSAESLAT
jgi:hypothetical protein